MVTSGVEHDYECWLDDEVDPQFTGLAPQGESAKQSLALPW